MINSGNGINDEIRQADDSFETIFEQQNAEGMADLYTENGMLLPTGSDFVAGKNNIRDFWQGAMEAGIKKAKLDIKEVELQGDTAIEVGQYKLSGADDAVMDQGKYIVIWKQENGQWKLHRDIWNSSLSA